MQRLVKRTLSKELTGTFCKQNSATILAAMSRGMPGRAPLRNDFSATAVQLTQ
jgi:hypothetical protein